MQIRIPYRSRHLKMASALIAELTSRFSLDGVDIDNWTFKFYSRVTVGIFMMAAAASTASSYGGDAIKCLEGKPYDESYCWLHGTSHLPLKKLTQEITNNDHCLRYDPNEIFDYAMGDKDTKYYIWVSLVLFLNGILFIIPDQLWKHFEGNMLQQFGSSRMDFLSDPKEAKRKFSNLSNNQTKRYFFTFLFFELLYFLTAIVSFTIIDKFLSGRFYSYGIDAMNYYAGNVKETDIKTSDDTVSVKLNPMCSVFPTIVNCDFKFFGVGGDIETRSNICILGQNLMNQKTFLVVWIWFMVLFGVTICQILYRFVTLVLVDCQINTIQQYAMSRDNEAVKKIELGSSHIGNWFLLTQIGRNSDPYKFRQFLNELTGTTGTNKKNKKGKVVDRSEKNEGTGNGLDAKESVVYSKKEEVVQIGLNNFD